jgi:hypothetical protein
MMKHEGKPMYRFARARRPAGAYSQGLPLEGVTSKFGLIGIGMLMAVGIAMLLIRDAPKENNLIPIRVTMQAPPYKTPKVHKSVLLPITNARVLALDPAAFAAADTAALFALKKGEIIDAWLSSQEAEKWNNGVARKDFYRAFMIQNTSGKWIVNYQAYQKKASKFGSQGWWVILLGILLVPYQLIKKPRIPVWITLSVFVIVLVLWNIF